MDGEWEEQPGAIILSENDAEDNEHIAASHSTQPATRGRGGKATARKPTTKAAAKLTTKAPASRSTRRTKVVESEDEDNDDDVIMVDPEPEAPRPSRKAPTRLSKRTTAKPSQATRQTKLNFASQTKDLSEDEISDDDDDDAFEPASTTSSRRRR